MGRIRVGVVGGVALLTLLAACSSSSSSSSSSAAPGGATTAAPSTGAIPAATADSAASALLPAAIKSKGSVTVALDATYAPDEFIAADGTTIDRHGRRPVDGHRPGPRPQGQPGQRHLRHHHPGPRCRASTTSASRRSPTPRRASSRCDFVTYFKAGEGFYVRRPTAPRRSTASTSLCGHTVAVETGTTEQTDAQTAVQDLHQRRASRRSTVLSFPDQNEANLALSSGRAERRLRRLPGRRRTSSSSPTASSSWSATVLRHRPLRHRRAQEQRHGRRPLLAAVKDLMSQRHLHADPRQVGRRRPAPSPTPVINGATS